MMPVSMEPLAAAGVAVLSLSAAVTAGPASSWWADVMLLDAEALTVSPGAIPTQDYIDEVSARYINPATPIFTGQPTFAVNQAIPVFKPEGLYPESGVKSLTLDTSVAQSREILDSTITQQIAAGHDIVVSGYSQASTASTMAMRDLLNSDHPPTGDQLSFVLLADPNNPDGGILERFNDPNMPTLSLPSLGITFSGATPSDTPWDTVIYTGEYDGIADFPRYPLNLLADLNAVGGMAFVHGSYPDLSLGTLATAVPVPVSADYTGHTEYFMIPTAQLPLAEMISGIPVIGKPLADLLGPDLRVLVNLGYGPNPDIGWSTTGANLATPFGLFPSLTAEQFGQVLQALATGAKQGLDAFAADLAHPAGHDTQPDGSGPPDPSDPPSLIDIVNAFSSAAASAYAALLPTADIINAAVTTLPAYDISLFVHELTSGQLLDAVGMPIAATIGLGTMAGAFELLSIVDGISGAAGSLGGLSG